MILTCPSCAARYLVGAEKIGPTGRQVRCGRCRHTWYQAPADEPPLKLEPIPRTPEPSAAAPLAAEPLRAQAGLAADELRPIPRGSNLPALSARARRREPVFGWVVLVLVLAAMLYGTFVERARITAAWPPAGRLFMLLGITAQAPGAGLEIREVTTTRSNEEGVEVLLIVGEVANVSRESRNVPMLTAVLKDARQRNVQQWDFKAGEGKLLPGEVTKFSTSVKNPAGEATDAEVEFLAGKG